MGPLATRLKSQFPNNNLVLPCLVYPSMFDLASDAVVVPSAIMYAVRAADLSAEEPQQAGRQTTLQQLLAVAKPGENKTITVRVIAVSRLLNLSI